MTPDLTRSSLIFDRIDVFKEFFDGNHWISTSSRYIVNFDDAL